MKKRGAEGTWIITNPRAGSGKATQIENVLRRELPHATLVRTEAPGDAERLARLARQQGATVVAAVGGDGTFSECVTGLCLNDDGSRAHTSAQLSLIPAGTGGDFRRTFSFPNSLQQALTRLVSGIPRRLDVGIIHLAENEIPRAFVNVMSFGLGGETARRVEAGPKWLGGRTAFFWGALQATLVQVPVVVELELDGELVETAPFSNVAICNGQFFGGGMHICPSADPSDGFLDVVTMELSKPRTLSLSAHIYQGTHLRVAGVKHYRCKTLRARPTRGASCLLEADGEQLGELPLAAEIWPDALTLLT
jgi:YegS/Rv2252/BmrU family lipid kinase